MDLLAILVLGVLVILGFEALGVPSPPLFAGLLVGLARALAVPRKLTLPQHATTAAQVVIGVKVGTLVQMDTVVAIASDWLPVLLVTVATLVLSLVAGQLMALRRGISRVTGAFSMVAGGASGITLMARELGADERMVAVLQYLRVLLIVLTLPAVALLVFSADPVGGPGIGAVTAPGWWTELGFTAVCGVVGTAAATLLRLPVASLLGPMLVAAALDLGGLSGGAGVPFPLAELAFLVVGLLVGLNFTRASLRMVREVLPLALAVLVVLSVACAGLGVALAAATGVSPLDGYLATTPGGMNAVLVTATSTGADTTFVLAVQLLRLFVMLLSAPLIARLLRRWA
ncbi:AbrB family transcriptional regulator [Blastococcus sp. HT6-30]|uniref:AbrB family transcriptional regulator n=1 Tax=Blastococcus sp. HT6-30 TaxID=3144843 RepID=UPI00321A53A7